MQFNINATYSAMEYWYKWIWPSSIIFEAINRRIPASQLHLGVDYWPMLSEHIKSRTIYTDWLEIWGRTAAGPDGTTTAAHNGICMVQLFNELTRTANKWTIIMQGASPWSCKRLCTIYPGFRILPEPRRLDMRAIESWLLLMTVAWNCNLTNVANNNGNCGPISLQGTLWALTITLFYIVIDSTERHTWVPWAGSRDGWGCVATCTHGVV